MRHWISGAAFALLLASAGPLRAQAVPPPAAPAPASAPSTIAPIPAIHYTSRTLANGLRVYAVRDPGSSNVSVQVWYNVGSRDDPRGRSGFAHLFEHMMFKASRNLVPEQFDRLTEDVGGYNNASTNDDYTNYYEVVPANHLERLLWAEAERMGSLVVQPDFFASERDVVKEEYRARVLAAPYGRMFYLYFPEISYDVLPYGRPGIGSIADLDAATIEDVRAFHATYYRPDNAVLVVAGNFDPAQLDQWVDHYFGPIPRPAGTIPRVTVEEPVRAQARHYTVYEPNTPLPAVLLSYPAPPAGGADAAAMEVLDGILSTGDSSRLHDTMVYRDQVATQASSYVDQKQGRGNLAVYAILATGHTPREGEAGLRREVARLRDTLATPAELQEAKNELLTTELAQRETVDGQASAIAEAVVLRGDAEAANRRLEAIAAVTAEDVQRVARTWLQDQRSAALLYLPEESRGSAHGDTLAPAATLAAAPLVPPANVPIIQPAPAAERQAPPAPGPEVTPAIPAPVTQHLANGLTVMTLPSHGVPIATAMLVTPDGAADDPAGRAGLAALTASVMTEATATRSSAQVHAAAESLGASLSGSAGWDGGQLSLTVRSPDLGAAVALLADVARNATLPAEELERQRAIAADAVRVAMRDPGDVAGQTAARALYGDAPYGHPAGGTEASLAAISRGDVEAAYRAAWRPDNATLILTGDVDPAQALAIAQRNFGDWPGSPAMLHLPAAAPPPPRTDVIVVDMPGAGQAAVSVARNAIARADPRFYPALVANAVLGGGYSARLNQEIRIRRGLSYGSGSSLDARRAPGPFAASTQTRNDAAAQVLALILAEMRRLGAEPVPAAELAARRASLTGEYGRNVETSSGLAQLVASYVQRGIDPAELQRYQPSVSAVTPAQAQAAAAELLAPEGATIVIVGDAAQFLPALRRDHANVTVIPIADLRLDHANLR
jgi:zinc protease